MMQKFRVNSIAMESGHYPGRQWMGQSNRLFIPSEVKGMEMTNDEHEGALTHGLS